MNKKEKNLNSLKNNILRIKYNLMKYYYYYKLNDKRKKFYNDILKYNMIFNFNNIYKRF